jgi:hypothetical protein
LFFHFLFACPSFLCLHSFLVFLFLSFCSSYFYQFISIS